MTQRSVRAGFYKKARKLSKYETQVEDALKQKRVYTATTDDTSTLTYVPDLVIVPDQDNSATAILLPTTYFDEDKQVTVVNNEVLVTGEDVTVGGVTITAGTRNVIYFDGTSWASLYSETLYGASSGIPTVVSKEATGTLTTGEILALNATPITAIAAPGASKAIIVDEVQLFLDYNAATYVAGAGEDLTLQYSGGLDILAIDNDVNALLIAAADAHWLGQPGAIYDAQAAATGDGVLITTFDNEAVEFTIASGEVATGDSPIKYRISYREIDYLA
jgi:hypothetical protein